jgi:ankyrin repeat protein
MDAGADVRVRDNYGGNALILCADDDNPSTYIMRLLLDAGIYIDTQDVNGMTPLMLVSSSTNLSALELLLSDGANPNIRNNKGDTALIIASRSNLLENVRMLLKYGAYTNIKNVNGETAYTVTTDHDIKNLLGKHSSSMMSKRHGGKYVDVYTYNTSQ